MLGAIVAKKPFSRSLLAKLDGFSDSKTSQRDSKLVENPRGKYHTHILASSEN